MSKLRILELFGGIGACSKALERLGIDYEIADYVEIDKYAVASFNAMHNTNFEPQDICEWNKDIEVDLIMHGSPCQSISLAGLQHGADKGSGTRSSLMWETIRIVEKLKPKYVIWENVKNLLSKKHIHNFDAYLETMEQLGYTNYYQVLNAKDYGIPQNRERVFTISILNSGSLKDISFEFPPKQELKLKLKDLLEYEVDEKYYLSEKMIEYISATGTANFKNPDCKINLDIARPLTTDPNKRAGTTNYLCNDLPSNYDLRIIKDGGLYKNKQAGSIYNENGLCPTITTEASQNWNILLNAYPKIRKLTPKECWRLMGFDDEDFEKASKVNSNTQLYKQAGNSIVVNVLEAILTNLLLEPVTTSQETIEGQTTIFDYIGDSNE